MRLWSDSIRFIYGEIREIRLRRERVFRGKKKAERRDFRV